MKEAVNWSIMVNINVGFSENVSMFWVYEMKSFFINYIGLTLYMIWIRHVKINNRSI